MKADQALVRGCLTVWVFSACVQTEATKVNQALCQAQVQQTPIHLPSAYTDKYRCRLFVARESYEQ